MRQLTWMGLAVCVSLAYTPTRLHAYSLRDHGIITTKAVLELNTCFPGLIRRSESEKLLEAVRSEDLNLVRKWYNYSHFYHPKKKLRQRRLPSSARVADLEEKLQDLLSEREPDWDETLSSLGQMIHHFQDVTSPVHIVPVMHGPFDQFESFKVNAPEIASSSFCPKPSPQTGMLSLLQSTALRALARLDETFSLRENGTLVYANWHGFWLESKNDEFGSYGKFGDRFGETSFKVKDREYLIDRAVYTAFKAGQMRIAIEATKIALVQVYDVITDKRAEEDDVSAALRTP